MAVIVFVWTDSETGHAALSMEGRSAVEGDPYATYISFYPDPRRTNIASMGTLQVLKGVSVKGIPGTPTTMKQNLHSDVATRKRIPQYVSAPINGLDEDAIARFWADFRTSNPTWSLLKNSCADVVYQALEAGGAAKKSFAAAAVIALARHQFVTPTDCRELAKLLED